MKYLGNLRGPSGAALFFHWLCYAVSPVSKHPVDICGYVAMDGTQACELCLDMYHPRRSNLAPLGLEPVPYPAALGIDLALAYGVNACVEDFPHGLPAALIRTLGEVRKALARQAQERLDTHRFSRIGRSTDVPDEAELERAKRWVTSTQMKRDKTAVRLYKKVLKGERPRYSLYLRAFEDEEGGMLPEHRAHEQLLAYYLGEKTPLVSLASTAASQRGQPGFIRETTGRLCSRRSSRAPGAPSR